MIPKIAGEADEIGLFFFNLCKEFKILDIFFNNNFIKFEPTKPAPPVITMYILLFAFIKSSLEKAILFLEEMIY